MPNTPNSFDNFLDKFILYSAYLMLFFFEAMMVLMAAYYVLLVIGLVIFILVLIVTSIKDYVKKYWNRSNNCGDGAPEDTSQRDVEDKEEDVPEGEDKDKESYV